MKKQVALIFGGMSSEHEISCKSVLNVLRGFDKDKYDVILIGITKEGKWLLVESGEDIRNGSWLQSENMAVLSPDRSRQGVYIMSGGESRFQKIDVIFPALHGKFGEDGTIQGLFEMSGIPYVGCGVLSSAVGMDKISTKIFVERLGIRQAKYVTDIAPDLRDMEKTADAVESQLGYPVFVKPSNAGSSCGVSKAKDREELKQALKLAKEYDTRVLVEEAIVGHEVECAVFGGYDVKASRVGEIMSAAEFYDYEAKYISAESKTVIDPPGVPAQAKEQVREDALQIFKAIGGFGLSRVDFFVEADTNEIVFNEINTFPGFTDISMYPMLCGDMGLTVGQLVDRFIEMAYDRV